MTCGQSGLCLQTSRRESAGGNSVRAYRYGGVPLSKVVLVDSAESVARVDMELPELHFGLKLKYEPRGGNAG